MCLYLTKRTGGMYYFRRAIPDELRPAFDGRTEFMFSLRTKDKDAAKRKPDLEAVRTTALLENARARLSPPATPAAAPTVASRALTERELAGVEYEAMELAAKDARRDELSEYIAFLERLKGSTEQMPKELRAFRYILEGREFDHGILEDQLRIASAKLREAEQRLADPQKEMPSQSPGEAPQGRNTNMISLGCGRCCNGRSTMTTHANVAKGIQVKDTDAAKNKRKELALLYIAYPRSVMWRTHQAQKT